MFDDLAWAFDSPPRAVIEMALRRLGVPESFIELLRDMDNMSLKDTILEAGRATDHGGEFHQVLFGTPQGSVEGPSLWMAVADITVDYAENCSEAPVVMDAGPDGVHTVGNVTFVDDSAYGQEGDEAKECLARLITLTGKMYYFLGLRRRPKKCIFSQLIWVRGHLQRMEHRPVAERGLRITEWISDWTTGEVRIGTRDSFIQEYDYDHEFRHLGYTASLAGDESKQFSAMHAEASGMADAIESRRGRLVCSF